MTEVKSLYDIGFGHGYAKAMEEAGQIKHGRWQHYEGMITCSVCRTKIYDDIMELLGDDVPRYCPNCGADMRVRT